jgi:glycerophosphoryl diester phosphodiesterase
VILGHRGAPTEAPENTLLGFQIALAHGADGVELDVQRSRDGVPVVIHDSTLERTTNGRGRVDEHNWEALRKLVVGGSEPIPSLEEIAAWAANTGAWLNVELKSGGAEAASLAVLQAAGVLDQVLFSSFLPEVVREIGRLAPDSRRYLLLERWEASVPALVRELGAGGVCLRDDAATPRALGELAEAGLPVVVWTVDDPVRIRELLRARVAAVITNRPDVAVAERAALNL